MPTMNVNLSDDLVAFVGEQTNGGGYANQSEVVREALRLLRSRRDERRVLARALETGYADTKASRVKPLTDELLRDIAARGHKQTEAHARRKR